jgi:hypothetical protein
VAPDGSSLSVVIPTHNRAQLVQRAVTSALREGAEVVVVDDASADDTQAAMQRLVAAEPGVRYERLSENRGPCHARNVGVELATRELVLFLDDDDALMPGGGEVIRRIAGEHPSCDLYLHNCLYPGGRPSIDVSRGVEACDYVQWLAGRFEGELKPVVRRELFPDYHFPDTGASGEGLLWARVIRDRPALVSATPVVEYDTTHLERLTSGPGLIKRAEQNARIADAWLEEFGADLRAADARRWAQRVLASAMYHVLCGRGAHARAVVATAPRSLCSRRDRIAVLVASHLPVTLARALFLAHRGHLVAALRSDGLAAVRP